MDSLPQASPPWPVSLSDEDVTLFQRSLVERAPASWSGVTAGRYVELACLSGRDFLEPAQGALPRPRLHYLTWDRTTSADAARKDAPPVILLIHGVMDFSYRYEVLGPCLAERFKTLVLAPDLPGRGRSVFSGEAGGGGDPLIEAKPMTQNHSAEDYTKVMTEFVDKVVPGCPLWVVGHSMGGALAFLFTASASSRVERLALLSPAGCMKSLAPLRCLLGYNCLRGCVHGVMSGDQEKIWREDFQDWQKHKQVYDYMKAHQELQIASNRGHFLDPLLGSALQFPLFGLEASVEAFAKTWRKPLLLMFGRHDRTVPFATMQIWAKSLASGHADRPSWLKEHVVEESAHLFFWENPSESVRVLTDFLAGGSPPESAGSS